MIKQQLEETLNEHGKYCMGLGEQMVIKAIIEAMNKLKEIDPNVKLSPDQIIEIVGYIPSSTDAEFNTKQEG